MDKATQTMDKNRIQQCGMKEPLPTKWGSAILELRDKSTTYMKRELLKINRNDETGKFKKYVNAPDAVK